MTPHRLIVLGAGAIGAGVGALLHASGQDVVLVARGENGRALAAGGVDLRRPGGASRVPVHPRAVADPPIESNPEASHLGLVPGP